MSYEWFKLYHDLPDHINLRKFSAQEKWAWVALLCLASRSKVRGIISARDEDIADYCEFQTTQDWLYYRDKLIGKGMIEINADGRIQILSWEERQAKKPSDQPEAIRKRVSKHRAKKKQAGVTPSNALQGVCNAEVTPQIRSDQTREEEYLKISLVDTCIGDSVESQHASRSIESTPLDVESKKPGVSEPHREEEVIQGELVATEQSTRQGESSAPAKKTRSKKKAALMVSDCSDFQSAYNEYKPAMWAAMEVVTPKRQQVFYELVQQIGDRESARQVLINALRFASQDSWCRVRNLSFENFKSNNKIIQFHERWMAIASSPKGLNVTPENAQQLNTMFNYAKLLEDV